MASTRPPSVLRTRRPQLRRDPNGLVASAAVLTGKTPSRAKIESKSWQTEAWAFYDTVGELRFGVGWLANALSRVNLVAAIPPASQGDEPTPIDLETATAEQRRAVELVAQMAGGVAGQGQILGAAAKHLTVPGVGYVLALADAASDTFTTWRMLSNDEVKRQGGVVQYMHHETGDWTELAEADLLIKVWRSHPRFAHEADSPVRAVLTPLREIDLICKRIAADAESRLAGNGLLVLPTEVQFTTALTAGDDDTSESGEDDFVEQLVEVMTVPIGDRSSPAARVPLTIRVPGEFVDKVQWITFWSEFDTNLEPLRQAAVKRTALGLDIPPEVLLGLGDSNHWSAWQIAEEAITLHVEPLAETVCHAFTTGYLAPALATEGLDPKAAIVWYDTTDLTTRPDLSAAATQAHTDGVLSHAAYLRELGLPESDMPDDAERAASLLLQIALANPPFAPAILAHLGLIPQELVAVLNGAAAAAQDQTQGPLSAAPSSSPGESGGDARPLPEPPAAGEQPPAPSTDPGVQAAALLAAADGLVVRALERAGTRLRSAVGKGTPGGAAAVECPDPAAMHTLVAATQYASLDALLTGAWDRVPTVAARVGLDTDSLTACLDGYCRGLIAAGYGHDWERLADALGVVAPSMV